MMDSVAQGNRGASARAHEACWRAEPRFGLCVTTPTNALVGELPDSGYIYHSVIHLHLFINSRYERDGRTTTQPKAVVRLSPSLRKLKTALSVWDCRGRCGN